MSEQIVTSGVISFCNSLTRLTVSITCHLELLQAAEPSDFERRVLMKSRYSGEGNQEIVGAKPHFSCNLVDLAVENNHLPAKGFEGSQSKVAMLQKTRRRYGAGVNPFHES